MIKAYFKNKKCCIEPFNLLATDVHTSLHFIGPQFWSFWPAEWGRKLIVCLFIQTVAISPLNWELHSPLSPSLSQVDSKMLLKWSVSQLYALWISDLTPLQLPAPCVVSLLSVQSDFSFRFDSRWGNLSNCIWFIHEVIHMGNRLYVLFPVYRRHSITWDTFHFSTRVQK